MNHDFPSNRHKERVVPKNAPAPEEKKVEQVVSSDVVRRKKPVGKRLTETLIGGDARSVWGFVTLEVLVPAAKDMLADAVSQGIERMIFGEARSSSRRTGRRPGDPHISYNRMSGSNPRRFPGPPDDHHRHQMSRRGRASHDFDEIILGTRAEADEVIDRLFDLVSKYECATVADLYDLVGVSGSYTDNKWGWMDLRGAGVARVRHGYLLDLPKPEPLD